MKIPPRTMFFAQVRFLFPFFFSTWLCSGWRLRLSGDLYHYRWDSPTRGPSMDVHQHSVRHLRPVGSLDIHSGAPQWYVQSKPEEQVRRNWYIWGQLLLIKGIAVSSAPVPKFLELRLLCGVSSVPHDNSHKDRFISKNASILWVCLIDLE